MKEGQVKEIKDIFNHEKNKIRQEIESGEYGCSLQRIRILSGQMYYLNQFFCDDDLESALQQIAMNLKLTTPPKGNPNRVIFYDGFGLDIRGLARIYLRALIQNGKHVIYVTTKEAEGKIPTLLYELEQGSYNIEYFENYSLVDGIYSLNKIFANADAGFAFFYTMPNDVIGYEAFTALKGSAERYLINLTDHAFWLGRDCCDYFIEFRNQGYSVSLSERNIRKQQEIMLPYYPLIDDRFEFEGYPFDKGKNKVIFSGGSLYKTLDESGLYYQLIAAILSQCTESLFWYAGSGDTRKLRILSEQFPGRVFFTSERKDYVQILKHSDLYIDTYPMCGGLMRQNAAAVGTPLISMCSDELTEGFLLDESDIIYPSVEVASEIAVRLLKTGITTENKKKLMKKVIGAEEFREGLSEALEKKTTPFEKEFINISVKKFQKTYIERADINYIKNCILEMDHRKSQVEQIKKSDNKRKLIVWGAGQNGKDVYGFYRDLGLDVNEFVDKNHKTLKRCMELPVYGCESISRSDYVVISIEQNQKQFEKYLNDQGMKEGDDYIKWNNINK